MDSTRYFLGDDLLAAAGEGHWVEYVVINSAIGNDQMKHTWAVWHNGLIFCSGWYEE